MRFILISVLMTLPVLASAMPVKSQMLRPRAYFVEADNNLLEPLDLKSKSVTFQRAEFDKCGQVMVRQALTLNYSCTLNIPSKAKISKIQNLVTPATIEVNFGGTKRMVHVDVSPDAKSVTMSTQFDKTGIDFEISKFNDDFFAIYAKVAQLVMSEAMHKQPLRIEVLESRPTVASTAAN